MSSPDGNLTLVSACPRSRWIFHSFTFPGKEVYARKWGQTAAFYVHPEDMAQKWDRLRVWQEGLRQVKTGDWMWFLGPGCLITNPEIDWRSLGPFGGDMVIGGNGRTLNFESFFLRSTPETHLFLERVGKLKGVVGSENDAMTVLLAAELIKAEHLPRRPLAGLLSPDLRNQPPGAAAQIAYQPGDFVLQFPNWHPESFPLLQKFTAPARRLAAAPQEEKIHRTHCVQALGDNMAHVHFLRKLARRYPDHRFIHQAQAHYLGQLAEMIEDLPNITLEPMHRVESGSVDAWKNAEIYWETHPIRNEYAAFYIEFFKYLAKRMGLESPIETPADLLFDYPALQKPTPLDGPFDFLVVNSTPLSNQFTDKTGLDGLIAELAPRYKVIVTQPTSVPGVTCTQDHGLSVSGIGRLSTLCKYIVMISTGSSWGTFNVWNTDSVLFRVILIDHERIGLSKNTVQATNVDATRILLKEKGLL